MKSSSHLGGPGQPNYEVRIIEHLKTKFDKRSRSVDQQLTL